jgi:hypothetical protein
MLICTLYRFGNLTQYSEKRRHLPEEFYQETTSFELTWREVKGRRRLRWKKPPTVVFKINWDATLNKLFKKMGQRVIASTGNYVY